MTNSFSIISMIAAADNNLAIGYNNQLPWRGTMKSDMSHFIRLTTDKSVIMGRPTIESIGKALKNRKNIVLSRNPDYVFEGAIVVSTIEQAIEAAGPGEIMVIGGEQIYKLFMPFCDRIYLTHVEDTVENSDAFFPEIKDGIWTCVDRVDHLADEKNYANYSFATYERM